MKVGDLIYIYWGLYTYDIGVIMENPEQGEYWCTTPLRRRIKVNREDMHDSFKPEIMKIANSTFIMEWTKIDLY